VSTNLVLLSPDGKVYEGVYLPTRGRPIEAIGPVGRKWNARRLAEARPETVYATTGFIPVGNDWRLETGSRKESCLYAGSERPNSNISAASSTKSLEVKSLRKAALWSFIFTPPMPIAP